jgi:hypothetical protein
MFAMHSCKKGSQEQDAAPAFAYNQAQEYSATMPLQRFRQRFLRGMLRTKLN